MKTGAFGPVAIRVMKAFFLGLGLLGAATLHGQVTLYSGASAHADWLTAAGGTPVVLDFESITANTQANSGSFVTYAATAGVVFLPLGNSAYPQVILGEGGIGAIGSQWLGNKPWQGFNPDSAISWTFNEPIRAFGFYDVGTDDGFVVTVYSTGLSSIGNFLTAEIGTPSFWGFVANQDIGRVDVQPRTGFGNGYIGIDGLSTVAIPEPRVVFFPLFAVACLGLQRRFTRMRAKWRRKRCEPSAIFLPEDTPSRLSSIR